jgi:hypothetical protein
MPNSQFCLQVSVIEFFLNQCGHPFRDEVARWRVECFDLPYYEWPLMH